jgi:hypothetical protein
VADSPMAVALAHLHQPLPPPRSINPDLPAAAEQVLLTALAKDPAARFESASAMIRAVERAEEAAGPGVDAVGGTLPLPPVGAPPTAASGRLPMARLPTRLVVGVFVVLLALGGLGLVLTRLAPATTTSGATPVDGTNALLNPSFEQGGGRPTAWRPGTPSGGEPEARMEWSADVSRGGGRSVAIGQPRTGAVWWFDWPGAEGKERAVRVPTGATAAQVAVWCKADDPAVLAGVPPGPSDEDSNQPYLHLRKIAKDGIDYDVQWFALGCTLDWTENSFSTPIPGDAEYLLVWLGLNGPSSATVWFDDVALILR